jgi:chemotaxis signal transduction protein
VNERSMSRSAQRLREQFDASFAHPPVERAEQSQSMIFVRARQSRLALRAEHVAKLLRTPAVTRLPTPMASLRGLSVSSGRLIALYDLAALLGHGAASVLPWAVLCQAESQIALGFEELDGYRDVPVRYVLAANSTARPWLTAQVELDGDRRDVVDIGVVLQMIQAGVSPRER